MDVKYIVVYDDRDGGAQPQLADSKEKARELFVAEMSGINGIYDVSSLYLFKVEESGQVRQILTAYDSDANVDDNGISTPTESILSRLDSALEAN